MFEIKSLWFSQKVEITTFNLEELLATKLRALYQRKKGRDLFDIVTVLKSYLDLDVTKILKSFEQYMSFDKTKVSRAEFEANLAEKLNDEAFIQDIFPLLPYSLISDYDLSVNNLTGMRVHATTYHPLTDICYLKEKIIAQLPGEKWKGEF